MVRPSMRDVAAQAGVSPKTVSNVVRGWPAVSDQTRTKVNLALDELGYRMNQSPRMMRSGRSGLIAVAVPWLDSPYFAELTSQIVRQADVLGLTVLVDQTDGLRDKELAVLAGLQGQPIDGLIFSPYEIGEDDLMTHRPKLPTVLLGERIGPLHGDHVAIDNVAAALDLVTHLVSLGRTRIAAIGHQGVSGAVNARQRARGYELALRAAGMQLQTKLQMTVTAYGRNEGADAMYRLLNSREPFDAVFCFSDLLALGAMHAAHSRGLSVPKDIAIAGFDDIEDGRFSCPPLTTVSPDKAGIARSALALLTTRLDSQAGNLPPRDVSAAFTLALRGSTQLGVPRTLEV